MFIATVDDDPLIGEILEESEEEIENDDDWIQL
jgi:hypothetical protein